MTPFVTLRRNTFLTVSLAILTAAVVAALPWWEARLAVTVISATLAGILISPLVYRRGINVLDSSKVAGAVPAVTLAFGHLGPDDRYVRPCA